MRLGNYNVPIRPRCKLRFAGATVFVLLLLAAIFNLFLVTPVAASDFPSVPGEVVASAIRTTVGSATPSVDKEAPTPGGGIALTMTLESPVTITIQSPANSGGQLETPAPSLVTATTHLALDTTDVSRFVLTSTFLLEIPSNRPEVADLLQNPSDRAEYQSAIGSLLPPYWVDRLSYGPPAQLTIDHEIAGIAFTETQSLSAGSSSIGPWRTDNTGMGFLFTIDKSAVFTSANWITSTTWIIDVQLFGSRLLSATLPLPQQVTEEPHVTWVGKGDLRLDSRWDHIEVLARPEQNAPLVPAWLSNIDDRLLNVVRLFSQYLVILVILLVSNSILAGAVEQSTGSGAMTSSNQARRVVWITVLLPIATLAFYAITLFQFPVITGSSSPGSGFADPEVRESILASSIKSSILFGVAALWFLSASLVFQHRIGRSPRDISLGRRTVLSVIIFSLMGFILLCLPFLFSVTGDAWWTYFDRPWWLLLLVLPYLLMTYYLIAGLARLAVAFLPDDLWTRIVAREGPVVGSAAASEERSAHSMWLGIMLFGAALLVFVQWLTYVNNGDPGFNLLAGVLTNPNFGSSQAFEHLFGYIAWYPFDIFNGTTLLLPYVFLSATLAAVYQISGTLTDMLFTKQHRSILLAVAFLFSIFVVGIDSFLFGVTLPIASLLSFLFLRGVLLRQSLHIARAVQGILTSNTGLTRQRLLSGSDVYLVELLQRAKSIRELEYKQEAQYKEFTEAKKTADQDTMEYRLLEQEKEQLRRGLGSTTTVTVPVGLVLPATEKLRLTPHRVALALGPGGTWWQRGKLALRAGWKLAILPVGFYVYVLLTESGKAQWLSSSQGAVSIASGLLQNIVFWLIAAFIMGCVYPYIPTYLPWNIGALKGATLAGVYALSQGLNALVVSWLGQRVENLWLFRVLELLLYLVALGVILDLTTVREKGFYWRNLTDYYPLRDARFIAAYLAPLALAVATIAQQILSGQAQQAITETIKNLPNVVSPPGFG